MSQVVIENPIINSPFDEPTRYFRFTDEGITNEEVGGRRVSSYFVPIARPKAALQTNRYSRRNGRRTASKRISSSTASNAVSYYGARAASLA